MQRLVFLLAFYCFIALQTTNGQAPDNKDFSETIHLTTDRKVYMAGENIWFTAFYSDNNTTTEQHLSRVLYVEIYNNASDNIIRKKFEFDGAKIQGHIAIPQEIVSGNYYMRAYTQWIRNFPAEQYFYDVITILNPHFPQAVLPLPEKQNIELYPSIDAFLQKPDATYYFTLNNEWKNSITKIAVKDTANNLINNAIIYDNGLGYFNFSLTDTTKYFLELVTSTKDTIHHDLDIPFNSVLLLEIDKSDEIITCSMLLPDSLFQQNKNEVCQLNVKNSDFETVATQSILLHEHLHTTALKTEDFSTGLHYFILQNNTGEVLAIRPEYLEQTTDYELNILTNSSSFQPREEVEVTIETEQAEQLELLSVSVVKKGTKDLQITDMYQQLIGEPLLMKFLLQDRTLSVEEQIQLNMVCYISNYFPVNQSFADQLFFDNSQIIEWLPETRGTTISGVLSDKNTGKPLSNAGVFATVVLDNQQFHQTTTNENGQFIVVLNNVYNENRVLISPENSIKNTAEVVINSDFSNEFPELPYLPLQLDSTNLNFYHDIYLNTQIGEKFAPKTIPAPKQKVYEPIKLLSSTISVTLSDYIELPTMQEVFREIIPNSYLRTRNDSAYFAIYNPELNETYTEPLVLVDYVPIYDTRKILEINPSDIELVEIINEPFHIGDFTTDGLVLIKSKEEKFAGVTFPENSVLVEFLTPNWQSHPVFPDYASNNNSNAPDFRNLLFYSSNIDFNQPFRFFTSDHCSDYQIIVLYKTTDGCINKSYRTITVEDGLSPE